MRVLFSGPGHKLNLSGSDVEMPFRKVCCFTNFYEGFVTSGVKATWAHLEQALLFHWLGPVRTLKVLFSGPVYTPKFSGIFNSHLVKFVVSQSFTRA